jgi:CRP/FNR family transcriptional regulator
MLSVSEKMFLDVFPDFRNDNDRTLKRLIEAGTENQFPKGAPLYFEGDRCSGIGFLLAGEIRVFKIGENGREITLYEIFPGETCILNASCLLSRQRYPANATATTVGRVLYIPAGLFLALMTTSNVMQHFVFSLFSRRFNEIIELLEDVTFGRLDERLVEYLIEKSSDNLLPSSHQKIANDLGTSREVISRLLKDLERKGNIALYRNQVRIIQL